MSLSECFTLHTHPNMNTNGLTHTFLWLAFLLMFQRLAMLFVGRRESSSLTALLCKNKPNYLCFSRLNKQIDLKWQNNFVPFCFIFGGPCHLSSFKNDIVCTFNLKLKPELENLPKLMLTPHQGWEDIRFNWFNNILVWVTSNSRSLRKWEETREKRDDVFKVPGWTWTWHFMI